MILKWRCERLDMNSISYPCADARKRELANCVGCAGALEIEGEVVMATARVERVVADSGRLLPAYKVCKHPGCRKQITRKGLCWSHLREAGMDPQPGRKVTRKQTPAPLVEAVVNVRPAEVLMADMLAEIDAAWLAKRQHWVEDLAGATTCRSRSRMFLGMVDQLEGMEY